MKAILIFLLLIIPILIAAYFYNTKYASPIESKLVGIVLKSSAELVREKYHLIPSGSGVAMPGGPVRELFLAFDTKKSLPLKDLRKLLVLISNEILNQVISNQEIQPYLYEAFTIKNIHVVIFNTTAKGDETYDPGISTAQILKGVLTYMTVDAHKTLVYKNRYTETYEEAIKLINDG